MAIRMAMTAITIINSISVKPLLFERRRPAMVFHSPLSIRCTIACFFGALGIQVKDELSTPRLSLRVVTFAALSPIVGIRHRVFRDAAQETNLLVNLTRQFDALH